MIREGSGSVGSCCKGLLGALGIGILTLVLLAGPAWATSVTITGSMEGATQASPGDWLSSGYSLTMPGSHAAAAVSFVSAQVVIHGRCASNHATTQDITVPLSGGPYSIGVNNSNWFPDNTQSSAAVYQGAVQTPDFCSGGAIDLSLGATFNSDVQSTDTTDKVNVRFHYNDAATNGGHTNINCSDSSQNPFPGVSACSAGWSGTTSVIPSAITNGAVPVVTAQTALWATILVVFGGWFATKRRTQLRKLARAALGWPTD